jgi:hypothetical protein
VRNLIAREIKYFVSAASASDTAATSSSRTVAIWIARGSSRLLFKSNGGVS